MHANCIGMKAVLADGTIIDQMNPLERTAGGYDLKQLFIGSEGTLVSLNHIIYLILNLFFRP
jgi:FAD/FMN-containing dehydrogenase